MMSGKTTLIIHLVNYALQQGGKRVLLLAPQMSTRGTELADATIRTHGGARPLCNTTFLARNRLYDACQMIVDFDSCVNNNGERRRHDNNDATAMATPGFDLIVIEEGQFFDRLIDSTRLLRANGICVLVAGLTTNVLREPFGEMYDLLRYADKVDSLCALCNRCGAHNATLTFNWQMACSHTRELIGNAANGYVALCQLCYDYESTMVATMITG